MAKQPTLLIPMRVSAYVNYSSAQEDPWMDLDHRVDGPHAYLAPYPSLDPSALHIDTKDDSDSTGPDHDIYQHICDDIPLNASADPTRKVPEREGIYIHWSVPRHYRVAKVASSSTVADHGASNGSTTPQFPAVPDRYLVARYVDMSPNSDTLWAPIRPLNIAGQDTPQANVTGQEGSVDCRVDLFVVDSILSKYDGELMVIESKGVVRPLKYIPSWLDIENLAAPYIDVDHDPDDMPLTFLGATTPIDRWTDPAREGLKTASPLNIVRTANPFFADFQPHNSSVFSMFDSLETTTDSNIAYRLAKGKVSYSVVGWHLDKTLDPLSHGDSNNDGRMLKTLLERLRLNLDPSSLDDGAVEGILKNPGGTSLCHGAFRQIPWKNSKMVYPAERLQQDLIESQAVSVGTNAIDALFGWIRANTAIQDTAVGSRLLKLQTFALDVNDDLDSQLQAEDLLASNNFAATDGSRRAHFEISESDAKSDNALPISFDSQTPQLRLYNEHLDVLDALRRRITYFQRIMFDCWWASLGNQSIPSDRLKYQVDMARIEIASCRAKITSFSSSLESVKPSYPVKVAMDKTFFTQRDPTMLVVGASADQTVYKNDSLKIRVDGQDVWRKDMMGKTINEWAWAQPPRADYPMTQAGLLQRIQQKKVVPDDTLPSVVRLLAEGALGAFRDSPETMVAPEDFEGTDVWQGKNGWHPLFIEWQIEYHDIPWTNWTFKPCGPESRYSYAIRDDAKLADLGKRGDYRIISGRAPLIAQTAASLKTVLQQVFSKMNPDQLEGIVATDEREDMLAQTERLNYLSTNMSGFTDQLLGRHSGTHVQPVHLGGSPGIDPKLPSAAIKAGQAIGLTEADLKEMTDVMETTPIVEKREDRASNQSLATFKPCTHGQFRFTKFNIVDRWGQVVQGIRQSSNVSQAGLDISAVRMYKTALMPCLGEMYSVESLPDGRANTVLPREDKSNTFVQIPPCINQPARINACFVKESSSRITHWQSMEAHENPVRGYIVINYANDSLQLYGPEGAFICEYLIRQRGTTNISTRPFGKDDALFAHSDPLLKDFAAKLADPTYIQNLFHSISLSVQTIEARPGHYAESMLSILGRPLALVAFGTSLELSQPPIKSIESLSNPGSAFPSVTDYSFPVKIGDKDNIFDGLYGIFKPSGRTAADSSSFDFSNFYSYSNSDEAKHPPLLPLTPFYVDPTQPDYTDQRDSHLNVFGALVDPFTHVHIYSSLLPIKQLDIPHWAISKGLAQAKTFFKAGPILCTQDLPAASLAEDKIVRSGNTLPPSMGSVQIPASGLDGWAWMQPVLSPEHDTKFNILDVEGVPKGAVWKEGPYTVTEGYLTMRKPFTAPDAVV